MQFGEEGELDSTDRQFQAKMHNSQLHAAIRMVTERDSRKLYCPTDKDTKTGNPVIDVLRIKHPDARIPAVEF